MCGGDILRLNKLKTKKIKAIIFTTIILIILISISIFIYFLYKEPEKVTVTFYGVPNDVLFNGSIYLDGSLLMELEYVGGTIPPRIFSKEMRISKGDHTIIVHNNYRGLIGVHTIEINKESHVIIGIYENYSQIRITSDRPYCTHSAPRNEKISIIQ